MDIKKKHINDNYCITERIIHKKLKKNIIIIGPSRSGKTTLSNKIKRIHTEYNIIHADSILWGIIRGLGKYEYYTTHVNERKNLAHSEMFQSILIEIFNSAVRYDKDGFGVILESAQLEPKMLKELSDNNICICLGHGTLNAKKIMEQCRKYDTCNDWSYKISDEDLLFNCKKWHQQNILFKKECLEFGIKYIDTSVNREKIFDNIIKK